MTDKMTLKAMLQQAAEQSCDCPRRAGHDVDCQYWQEGVAEAVVRRAAELARTFHPGLFRPGEVRNAKDVYASIASAILADAGLNEEEQDE